MTTPRQPAVKSPDSKNIGLFPQRHHDARQTRSPASRVKMTAQGVREIQRLASMESSMYSTVQDDDGQYHDICDLMADESVASQTDEIYQNELAGLLNRYLPKLSARERQIIVRRYELAGTTTATLAAIASELGCSKTLIRMIELKALKRLAQFMRRDGIGKEQIFTTICRRAAHMIKVSEIRDSLPPELQKQLSKRQRQDGNDFESVVLKTIEACGGAATVDQILIAWYRATQTVAKRNTTQSRLHYMVKRQVIAKKGCRVFTLPAAQKQSVAILEQNPSTASDTGTQDHREFTCANCTTKKTVSPGDKEFVFDELDFCSARCMREYKDLEA